MNIVNYFVDDKDNYKEILNNPDLHVWTKKVFYDIILGHRS